MSCLWIVATAFTIFSGLQINLRKSSLSYIGELYDGGALDVGLQAPCSGIAIFLPWILLVKAAELGLLIEFHL